MTVDRDGDYLASLFSELLKQPKETEWLEIKENNDDPDRIGQYLSGLSNSAALLGKANAYLLWGVSDKTKEVVGTNFSPAGTKVGNEELENWLLRSLSPKINFRFYEMQYVGKAVVLLEIGAAFRHPVRFAGQEYIRVGSYLQKLKEYPEKERELWRFFDKTPFEKQLAAERLSEADVVSLLDYPSYFELTNRPLPTTRGAIIDALIADEMVRRSDSGEWDITNLGAILFAKNLGAFQRLKRKAARVVVYRGKSRVETIREQEGTKGYACGFQGLIEFLVRLLPVNEVIGRALRTNVPMFPELAVRELVANALIHQDFETTGTGPMIEVFDNRLEITNPGIPLVSTDRFLDSPPKSRNEGIASFMRRIGVCEERGSGIDKVVFQSEYYQLPAPIFEQTNDNTRCILFAHKDFKHMDKHERIRATYLHACLRYVEHDYMTNSTLRGRFGIEEQNSAMASRIIKDAMEAEAVKQFDESAGRKYMKYVPWWA